MRIRIAVLTVLIALLLSGCGAAAEEKQPATAGMEAAEGLLSGLQNADLEAIDRYSTFEAVGEAERAVFDPVTAEINLYHSMGLLRDNVDTVVQQKITTLCEKMRTKYVTEYRILSTEQGEKSETIEAEITYGYDVDNFLQSDELSAQFQKIMTDYTDNHMEEITKVLSEQGEDALYQKILTDTLPDMLKVIEDEIDNGKAVTVKKKLTAQELDGEWIITSISAS